MNWMNWIPKKAPPPAPDPEWVQTVSQEAEAAVRNWLYRNWQRVQQSLADRKQPALEVLDVRLDLSQNRHGSDGVSLSANSASSRWGWNHQTWPMLSHKFYDQICNEVHRVVESHRATRTYGLGLSSVTTRFSIPAPTFHELAHWAAEELDNKTDQR